jgi:hypothetical protein
MRKTTKKGIKRGDGIETIIKSVEKIFKAKGGSYENNKILIYSVDDYLPSTNFIYATC